MMSSMKPDTYKILSRAVEEGAAYAWNCRIFKYQDNPSDESAINAIHDAIMMEICEVFNFDENETITNFDSRR
jgi:hypothetical protein